MSRVYLLDATNLLYRAFHAIRGMHSSSGLPTNAAFGMVNMLFRLRREETPDKIIAVFDPRGPTLKHKIDPEYKANRDKTPDELIVQIPYVHRVFEALGVPVVVVDGVEADDVIGTLGASYVAEGNQVTVVTGDKDFCQLVGPSLSLLDTMSNKRTGPAQVVERMGVEAGLVIDLLAITGDKVDNIFGVPGVGPKGAAKLLLEYGSMEAVLDHGDELKGKRGEAVRQYADRVRGNRPMVTIETGLDLNIDPAKLESSRMDRTSAARVLRELEFHRFVAELGLDEVVDRLPEESGQESGQEGGQEGGQERESQAGAVAGDADSFIHADWVALVPPTEENPLWGAAFADGDELTALEFAPASIPPRINDPSTSVIGHSLKESIAAIEKLGISDEMIHFDTEVAAYLLFPGRRDYALADLARDRGIPTTNPDEPGQRALTLLQTAVALEAELKQKGMDNLFHEIEMPLVALLAKMESAGVKVDRESLAGLSEEYAEKIKLLEAQIYEQAGREFNPNSPKQLAQVLFEELKLPVIRKTATGYSTDAGVLDELALSHPLPGFVLEYRSFAKLKNSFIDTLPKLVDPVDGRIHASFHQTVTATGRLSSSNPNLQNIPIRGEEGRRIRQAFVAEPGYRLVSADYSQIELRVMAHMSDDKVLIELFKTGRDVHAETASRLFGVGPLGVTAEMRRQAKTVNFGILYGISPFGLARQLGVGRDEASMMIKAYFKTFPGVNSFISNLIEEAENTGESRTMLGRVRPLPEIKDSNRNRREASQRLAVNSPIQGSAADLIKRAMIDAVELFKREKVDGRMILQVHDELVFEVAETDVKRAELLVVQAMESAWELKVRLVAQAGSGPDWYSAHGA